MKHESDKLDALLYAMNMKLLPYQRKFVEKCLESDGKVYITMPPRVGWSDYMFMMRMLELVLQGERNDETN